MKIIRGLNNLANFTPPTQNHIITIGNYDGIHLGHQAILNQVRALSTQTGLPNILITFEPHPHEYFNRHHTPHMRFMSLREKVRALEKFGIKNMLILRFNTQLANLKAEIFIRTVLSENLRAKYIIVGADFKFGAGNKGDITLLEKYSQSLNYNFTAVPLYKIGNDKISSSAMRLKLQHNDLDAMQTMLGRPYTVLGRVIKGDGRGHALGFPTANISLAHKLAPLAGVYAVKIHGLNHKPLYGAANIGFRPTQAIIQHQQLLEVYIFNFNQNIYGKIIEVEFIFKLRDEKKFANFTLLQQQIAADVAAINLFWASPGQSPGLL